MISDKIATKAFGIVELSLCDNTGIVQQVIYHNEFTSQAQNILLNIIRGTDRIKDIYVGSGGNLNVDGSYAGVRVAPVNTETVIRRKLYEIPIQYTENSGTTASLVAAARPEAFQSANIDELALMTSDGYMLSHWVSPADPATGLATAYSKTEWLWLIVNWSLVFNLEI
jgi:hypothetical protein